MSEIDVLFSQEEIADRIDQLARKIAKANMENLLIVSILKGSFVFTSDLIRALDRQGVALEVEFLFLSSYRDGTKSTGVVEVLKDIDADVKGRNILIVDDILETGRTLDFAKKLLKIRQAKRVEICVLLDKPVDRIKALEVAYTGFDCPDLFVIGYGMDYASQYRQLPYIGVLQP